MPYELVMKAVDATPYPRQLAVSGFAGMQNLGACILHGVNGMGRTVQAQAKCGFGSRMIGRGLAVKLGGEVKIEFDRHGVVCAIGEPVTEAKP